MKNPPTNTANQRQYLKSLLNRIPKSEIQLQSKCAELLYFFYPDHWKRLVCVHNNSIRANTQGFGIVPGASDMYWLRKGGVTVYIEFKFGLQGKMSPTQIEWSELIKSLGHTYYCIYSEAEFWFILNMTNEGFYQPCEADIDNLIWLK